MRGKELFNKLLVDLQSLDYFSNFKMRKTNPRLYTKDSGITLSIEIDHWYDSDTQMMIVYPQYGVRFDILHRWFEKFSVKTIKDQRDCESKLFGGPMFGYQKEFYFYKDGSNYNNVFKNFAMTATACCKILLIKYGTLEKFFQELLLPVINHEKNLPDVGAEWIFRYLTLCKLVAPEMYDEFKALMLEHVKWMYDRKEPNVERYYDRLDEILAYMETPGNIK